ncbi:hypothetical protein [Bifidobacterium aerophilum]|uniref:Uncharacterized protein n=1 Tax=Bifidobacterium aerophilum TaxID=1798155 RepID=A0A6N9Z949_9BIFI|nr:hypothetical protein [Bifidobacterium aerophilum]NEG90605.1 hypothetical protein [Bifidobacterium aerophilum]
MRRSTMKVFRPQEQEAPRTIMDGQDHASRGDGIDSIDSLEAVKVSMAFRIEFGLQTRLREFCAVRGVKIGDFVNDAIREKLANEA